MKDSIIYQDILNEGRAAALINVILRLGSERLGRPGEGEKVAFEAIGDADRLDRIFNRLVGNASGVASWHYLLLIQ